MSLFQGEEKMSVDIEVTDVNGLKAFINKIGYRNVLQILPCNGLYTIIYDCKYKGVEK